MYELPKTVEVGGKEYPIRSDYRAVLDILTALSDPEMSDLDKAVVMLGIFYEDEIPQQLAQEALNKCGWFINCGQVETKKKNDRKLMDWEQDFQYIVAPINNAAGCDVRGLPYMHWWTFMGYYMDIGDCMFAQIVAIRKKLKTGKKLEKHEKEFYRDNREIIDFRTKYTEAENEFLSKLLGGESNG